MPRGMEAEAHPAAFEAVAIFIRLIVARLGIDAIAQRHDRQRLGRRIHRAMAAARMIGVAVRHRGALDGARRIDPQDRSEEHTSELQSLMRISYAVVCLTKKNSNDAEHTINLVTITTNMTRLHHE